METKVNAMLSIIQAAARQGMEIEKEDTIEEAYFKADDYLKENPVSIHFEHCELSGSWGNQSFSWADGNDISTQMWGEIFDWGDYKSDRRVYFHKEKWIAETREPAENFKAVNWFDIPDDGDEKRKDYVFVFESMVCADGSLAMLYDYMA